MSSLFDDYCNRNPESKLELIDGRLIVGNDLQGSKLLLSYILRGWGTEAAVALAPVELWEEALKRAYNAMDVDLRDVRQDREWARSIDFSPPDLSGGEAGNTWKHNQIRQCLTMTLFGQTDRRFGRSIGRDFVMRLGNNGLTPDLLFVGRESADRMQSWYLDGPADIAIEVVLANQERSDRQVKRSLYAEAEIREYWIVDPETEIIEFLRLQEGEYQPHFPDEDGAYRPANVPGLAFFPERLWNCEKDGWYSQFSSDRPLFEVVLPEGGVGAISHADKREDRGWVWGCLPFVPSLALAPVPIKFEEYIAWCPEAKFEYFGKPDIGGKRGVKHLLGMLIRTLGMVEAVKLLSPQQWLDGIWEVRNFSDRDEARKQWWWKQAKAAAEFLHERYGINCLGVIGDLVQEEPLNFWSEITLIVEGERGFSEAAYEAFVVMRDRPEIELLERDLATLVERQMIEKELAQI